VCTFRTV